MRAERATTVGGAHARCQAEFQEAGYTMVGGLVEPALAHTLWWYALERADAAGLEGDKLVGNGQAGYGNTVMERVLEWLHPTMERVTGLNLEPTYSYFRIYPTGAVVRPHTDRQACEVSVTLNVGQEPDEPWAFGVRSQVRESVVELTPGDAVVYRGRECTHWRDAYRGKRITQVLLHYVDRDGPLSHWTHHGRGSLFVRPLTYYEPLARRLVMRRARHGATIGPGGGPFGEYNEESTPDRDWNRRERELIEDSGAEDTRRWRHRGGPPTPREARTALTST